MTKTELKKLTLAQLRRKAADAGLPCCRDFTKADYVDALAARAARPEWRPEYADEVCRQARGD